MSLNLEQLTTQLKQSFGIVQKQDIQIVNQLLELHQNHSIQVGDDCAAISESDGYLLLAAEGMWHRFVEVDPWFAGWCAVMVNVSDIAAMGGEAIAVVDTLWTEDSAKAKPLLDGMKAASRAYNVPIVGGHTNLNSAYNALSVAILGRAKKLISSFQAQPGDFLIVAIDFQGEMHPQFSFWNAATQTDPIRLQQNLKLLPNLAENNLCNAGKDISMGGIIGTLLMLLEASDCGAILNLDDIIYPSHLSLEDWLLCFPSYGFLLSIRPGNINQVTEKFNKKGISSAVIGKVDDSKKLNLIFEQQESLFWDFSLNKFIQ